MHSQQVDFFLCVVCSSGSIEDDDLDSDDHTVVEDKEDDTAVISMCSLRVPHLSCS